MKEILPYDNYHTLRNLLADCSHEELAAYSMRLGCFTAMVNRVLKEFGVPSSLMEAAEALSAANYVRSAPEADMALSTAVSDKIAELGERMDAAQKAAGDN